MRAEIAADVGADPAAETGGAIEHRGQGLTALGLGDCLGAVRLPF